MRRLLDADFAKCEEIHLREKDKHAEERRGIKYIEREGYRD